MFSCLNFKYCSKLYYYLDLEENRKDLVINIKISHMTISEFQNIKS